MKHSSLQRKTPLKPGSVPHRKTRLAPKSRQLVKDKVLDDLCRQFVRLRDVVCQRCGSESLSWRPHQWSHVVTRGAKSARWVWWNSKLLCGGCHMWWGSHPLEAAAWFQQKWPDRYAAWQAWRHERRRPKIDRTLIKLHLEQEIAKLEGRSNVR